MKSDEMRRREAKFQFNNLTAKTHVKPKKACTFTYYWIFFCQRTKKSGFLLTFSWNFSVEKHVRVQKEDVNHGVSFANFPGKPSVFLKISESSDLRLLSDYQLELSAHNLLYHRSALLWFILGHWASNKPPLTVPGWRRRQHCLSTTQIRETLMSTFRYLPCRVASRRVGLVRTNEACGIVSFDSTHPTSLENSVHSDVAQIWVVCREEYLTYLSQANICCYVLLRDWNKCCSCQFKARPLNFIWVFRITGTGAALAHRVELAHENLILK